MAALYVALALGFSGLFLSRSFNESIVSPLSLAFADASGGVFRLAGVPTSIEGSIVLLPNVAVEIVNQCTGVGVAVLLFAAVLAFPSPWKLKLAGIAVSLAVMAGVNLVRILSLCWVGMYSMPLLEIGHLYVWPPVVMMVAVATFLLWIQERRQHRPDEHQRAGPGAAGCSLRCTSLKRSRSGAARAGSRSVRRWVSRRNTRWGFSSGRVGGIRGQQFQERRRGGWVGGARAGRPSRPVSDRFIPRLRSLRSSSAPL